MNSCLSILWIWFGHVRAPLFSLMKTKRACYVSNHNPYVLWQNRKTTDYLQYDKYNLSSCCLTLKAVSSSRKSYRRHLKLVDPFEYLFHIWRRLCSNCRKHNPVLFSPSVTYRNRLITGFVRAWATRRVSHMEPSVCTFQEHLKFPVY